MQEPLRIIKIGGSLLGRDDLIPAFEAWRQRQLDAINLCIVGGGEPVERIRHEQLRIHLDDETAHWRAIEQMSLNLSQLAELTGWPMETKLSQLASLSRHVEPPTCEVILFDVVDWLRQRTDSLPENWTVTSDSIAAALAIDLNADELVLLKSTDSDPSASFEQLAQSGIVDSHFPSLANEIPAVRCDNLLRGWLEE